MRNSSLYLTNAEQHHNKRSAKQILQRHGKRWMTDDIHEICYQYLAVWKNGMVPQAVSHACGNRNLHADSLYRKTTKHPADRHCEGAVARCNTEIPREPRAERHCIQTAPPPRDGKLKSAENRQIPKANHPKPAQKSRKKRKQAKEIQLTGNKWIMMAVVAAVNFLLGMTVTLLWFR